MMGTDAMKKTIVFLSGFFGGHDFWKDQIVQFERFSTVIVPDYSHFPDLFTPG